jgi:histidinol-phosphate aminotransferase
MSNPYYGPVKQRRTLRNLHEYVPGERRAGTIKLSSNENPLGSSPRALAAITESLEEMRYYPDGAARDLKRAISAHHGGIDSRRIVVGNGSDEILTLIAAAYINPGDRVLIGAHTFSQYEFSARLFDAEVESVPMDELAFDLDRFIDACSDTCAAVYLCSPNNPTGLVIPHVEFESFLDRIGDDRLVVVDHAYQDFVEDATALDADRLVASHQNLVVLHTFSKLYGLAALRVGYAITSPEIASALEKVRSPFNVNIPAQRAATAALEDTGFADRTLAMNRVGKNRMYSILSELGLSYLPTEANFVNVRVDGDAAEYAEAFAERGVTVRALASFGLPDRLRITIGTENEIDRLEEIMRELFA